MDLLSEEEGERSDHCQTAKTNSIRRNTASTLPVVFKISIHSVMPQKPGKINGSDGEDVSTSSDTGVFCLAGIEAATC